MEIKNKLYWDARSTKYQDVQRMFLGRELQIIGKEAVVAESTDCVSTLVLTASGELSIELTFHESLHPK